MSNPSSIRITDEGMKALKVLQQSLQRSRSAIVSEALVEKQRGITAQPLVQLQRLHPEEYLSLQADLSALLKLHEENRRLALKKHPSSKDAAAVTAAVVNRIDGETKTITTLRQRIASEGRLSEIARDNPDLLKKLARWAVARLESPKNEEHRQVYELELRIIKLLLQ